MKKATLVLATVVAFLLSGPAFAARKVVDMPSTGSILSNSTSTLAENGVLKVSGSALAGEYIPGVKNALAIIPETKIASSAISTLAKGAVRGGLVGIAGTLIIGEMLDGLDWVMHDGAVVKQSGTSSSVPTTTGQYQWNGGPALASDPVSACVSIVGTSNLSNYSASVQQMSETQFKCVGTATHPSYGTVNIGDYGFITTRTGNGCPSGATYNSSTGTCVGAVTYAPLGDSDLNTLDGFVKAKDGVWQRDLTTTLCNGDASCYKALSPDTSLTGPAKVTGIPQTVTTTNSNGSQSVQVKTPNTTITYGPNYYDYTTTTTTTNNNGGDSTTVTDDTDVSFPVPPDIFGGANDGIGGIRDGIPSTSASTSPIPYMAWWSFSQSCSEITFIIPVYGAVTTALCPIYKQYIWPVLYFFFAVFTWHSCFQIWRKTVMRVRAS